MTNNMDLTSEELRLLAGYYLTSDGPQDWRLFNFADLDKYLDSKKVEQIPLAASTESSKPPKNPTDSRAHRFNQMLETRKLIQLSRIGEDQVNLTVRMEGLDIGRKYAHFWGRADLWYQSHKDGLLGLVWSVLGGFLGAFIYHLLGLHN